MNPSLTLVGVETQKAVQEVEKKIVSLNRCVKPNSKYRILTNFSRIVLKLTEVYNNIVPPIIHHNSVQIFFQSDKALYITLLPRNLTVMLNSNVEHSFKTYYQIYLVNF